MQSSFSQHSYIQEMVGNLMVTLNAETKWLLLCSSGTDLFK